MARQNLAAAFGEVRRNVARSCIEIDSTSESVDRAQCGRGDAVLDDRELAERLTCSEIAERDLALLHRPAHPDAAALEDVQARLALPSSSTLSPGQ